MHLPEEIAVYPNPASETVTVSAAGGRHITAVSVHSQSGRLLSRWNIDPQQSISLPLGDIGYGSVLLSIRTSDGRYSSRLLLRKR